ncbi:MAG TPA: PilZ domain-containing protein [Vicinamibacterales bacterium]|jgi:hypothetical protein|nr:PilZ domain-containing protein [Vicinamibacterales bacterium]
MDIHLSAPRARRFPLHVPVRFRPPCEAGWREGRAINISHTGVLFQPKGPVPMLDEPVEICVQLSALTPDAADIVCVGRIVRMAGPGDGSIEPSVASTIVSYWFLPGA